jgi:hypothetical protein
MESVQARLDARDVGDAMLSAIASIVCYDVREIAGTSIPPLTDSQALHGTLASLAVHSHGLRAMLTARNQNAAQIERTAVRKLVAW